MNKALFKKLINQSESELLDFKRDQYVFEKASEEKKSELLKDILAFANVVKNKSAYILIGIEEIKIGRNKVIGVTDHIDDAKLQQFVKSKTRKQVLFSYTALEFEGKQIGIIEIKPQDQLPVFVHNDFGKVRKNIVYIRRGSSTDQISPDELLEKFLPKLKQAIKSSEIELEFFDKITKTSKGNKIDLFCMYSQDIEYSLRRKANCTSFFDRVNSLEEFFIQGLSQGLAVANFGLIVKNLSSNSAKNVQIELKTKSSKTLIFLDEKDFIKVDDHKKIRRLNSDFNIFERDGYIIISTKVGKLQPKSEEISKSKIHIYSSKSCKLVFEAFIYADNMPEPILSTLTINLKVQKSKLRNNN